MYVLGISCHYHDAAAAILKDGVLIAAAEKSTTPVFHTSPLRFVLNKPGVSKAKI
jgi:predicted NodU family carbamoyl transferase